MKTKPKQPFNGDVLLFKLKKAFKNLSYLSDEEILELLDLAGIDCHHYASLERKEIKRIFLIKLGVDTGALDNLKIDYSDW